MKTHRQRTKCPARKKALYPYDYETISRRFRVKNLRWENWPETLGQWKERIPPTNTINSRQMKKTKIIRYDCP